MCVVGGRNKTQTHKNAISIEVYYFREKNVGREHLLEPEEERRKIEVRGGEGGCQGSKRKEGE